MSGYNQDIVVPRSRADCVTTIGGMISDLAKIAKTVPGCMERCDLVQMVDCLFLFYTGYNTVKNQIVSYTGILSEEEVKQFLSAAMSVEHDLREELRSLTTACQLVRG